MSIVATDNTSTNYYRCLPSHYRGAACLLIHLRSHMLNRHVELSNYTL